MRTSIKAVSGVIRTRLYKESYMKRIIVVILVLAMVLTLCGCEKSTSITIRVHYGGYSIAGEDLAAALTILRLRV